MIFRSIILVVITCGWLIACQSTGKNASSGDDKSWPGGMRSMAHSVGDLMPYIFNKKAFVDPKNKSSIQRGMKKLVKASHNIPKKKGKETYGDDPLMSFNLDTLQDDLARARQSFDIGNMDYSHSVLRSAIGHCFQCHSASPEGPEYTYYEDKIKGLELSFTEKADYYVATRQFEKAIAILRDNVVAPSTFTDLPFEQTKAIKKYLALTVRVKKDPSGAISTLNQYSERKKIPYYMAENIDYWKQELKRWNFNKKMSSSQYKEARRLVKKTREDYGFDKHYVTLLRASSLLHEALKGTKSKKRRAEIFQLLGMCYENLTDLGLWSLPEYYFESCIKYQPGSQLAKECYKDFEKNVVLGYSGSSGIFVPAEEKRRLNELKKLAGYIVIDEE